MRVAAVTFAALIEKDLNQSIDFKSIMNNWLDFATAHCGIAQICIKFLDQFVRRVRVFLNF
jgi:hypothetical protein